MQAFTITAPGATEVREIPQPEPGPGEVLLRVRYVGFCGSDLNTFRGRNPIVSFPRIPGHEISAEIAAVGSSVPTEWSEGRPVTLSPYTACGSCPACRRGRPNCCRDNQTLGVQRDGAMAEYITAPWQRLFSSERLSLRELAVVEPLTVGAHAAGRGQVADGDTVLVLGCGAIGLGAVAGAAFRGGRVIAVDIDDAKLRLASRAGAVETINSANAALEAVVGEMTAGDGPDVVIEAIGLPATYRSAVDVVAFAGRVVYIGYAKEPVSYETKLFVQKELDIRGSRNASPDDFASVIQMLEAGRFPIADLITHSYRLAEAGRALEEWAADPPAFTKILIEV